MSKITLEMKSDRINSIISDYCTQDDLKDIEKDSQEEMVDIRVFNLMETMYPDNIIVAQIKKNEQVYSFLKSKSKEGKKGKSDVTLFNYFNNNSIDILIENKFDKTKGNPIDEAIEYCNNINDSGVYSCRIAIGFNLYDNIQLVTKVLDENGVWADLKINGKIINGFIGQEILQLIYSHAGVTEFNFKVKTEEKYTRSEFKKILDSDLPIIFRKMSDIASDDALKISFTVAFISLKVILEKQEDLKKTIIDESGRSVLWRNSNEKVDSNTINALRNVNDIKLAVKSIVGDTANPELREKYKDIFDLDKYTFIELVDKILKTESKNNILATKSSIMKMKEILDKIKRQTDYHYEFDLFGEVYESLANNKTKSDLGQYFTKRHIIRPLVNMMLKPNDLEGIINKYKTLCDPFCGTGGMLTESFKHIRTYCNEKYPNLDTSEVAKKVIYGYDIIESNVGKTKINMTLAEDGYSVIEQKDSLTTLNKEEIFDYIITNVPYGAGESDGIVKNISEVKVIKENNDRAKIINRIRTFERDNNTQKLEYNSLIKVVQLLKEGGKAIVIVPDGLLENPSFSKMREWLLVKCKIDMIISIPKFAFAPYTKEKTYALFLQKRFTYGDEKMVETLTDIEEDEKIYSYILDNDGYANSDKQYETSLRDKNGVPLHNEVTEYFDNNGDFHTSLMEQICKSRPEDIGEHFNEWGEKISGKKYGYIFVKDILNDYYYKDENEIESNKVYRLNLLPEKYFRPKEFENLTIDELKENVERIKNELKDFFNEVK